MNSLLADIVVESEALDSTRGERGFTTGPWSSTPLSRRAPANLDVIVLRDRRTGVLAVLMHWAARIRFEHPDGLPRAATHTVRSESRLIAEHWDWAVEQPWGPKMVEELDGLRDLLHRARYGAPLRLCPVCGEPVRVDRFVAEHRACIDVPV